jgi:hypothetical protein
MHKPTFARASQALFSLFVTVAALASVSCSSSSSATATDGGTGVTTGDATVSGSTPLPCDVNKVVVEQCQSCHGNPTQNAAPMSLVTWEDFQAVAPNNSGSNPTGEQVYKLAETRIHATVGRMPQAPNPALDTADMATMDSWIAAGAPAGTGACTGDAGATVPDAATPSLSCTTDNVQLRPASPYTAAPGSEEYVCYSVNLPATGTNHVIGVTPNIDNHTVVHHVLLFQADANDTSVTTTPAPCNAGGSLTWRIVYGWAPGGTAMVTPPGVGFPYDATTKWVVQVHYNAVSVTQADGPQNDSSGFSFCSTDQPIANDADVVAFGTQNIKIPAHSTLDQTCNMTVNSQFAGIHLFAAFPHMHTTGTAIQTEQSMSGGGVIGLGENAPWDFNAQLWFPIQSTLNLGDVVSTRCAYQNSTASEIDFGEYTENEMCYSFTAYYPKITSGAWSWALPAIESSCAPTAGDAGLPMPDAGWQTDGSFAGAIEEDAGN